MCKGKLVLVGGRLFMLLVVAYIGRHMWGEKSKVHMEVVWAYWDNDNGVCWVSLIGAVRLSNPQRLYSSPI